MDYVRLIIERKIHDKNPFLGRFGKNQTLKYLSKAFWIFLTPFFTYLSRVAKSPIHMRCVFFTTYLDLSQPT